MLGNLLLFGLAGLLIGAFFFPGDVVRRRQTFPCQRHRSGRWPDVVLPIIGAVRRPACAGGSLPSLLTSALLDVRITTRRHYAAFPMWNDVGLIGDALVFKHTVGMYTCLLHDGHLFLQALISRRRHRRHAASRGLA